MTAPREAIVLPLTFLTVVLLGGVRIAERVTLVAPPPFALVLAMLLFGALVTSGVLAPQRLMDQSRSSVENMNGLVVLLAVFAASAQAFNAATPVSGLPRVLFHILFLVLLLNTLAASAGRLHLLRSLLVIFGSAFTLKFVVLAGLSDPAGGQLSRVLQAIFEGVTLGMVTQGALHPATAYLAFFALVLFLFGLMMLPPSVAAPVGGEAGLVRVSQEMERTDDGG
jgi:hypothetical protein